MNNQTYSIERFCRLFWFWLGSVLISALFFILNEGFDGDITILVVLSSIVTSILLYCMLWALCDDILERKGYTPKEIPLVRIVFLFGPFIFFYILALPVKTAPSTVETSTDNKTTTTLETRNEVICETCGYVNYCDGSVKNDICKKCKMPLEKTASSFWKCPKCGKQNDSSVRTCKDCGYQK